MSTTGSRKLPQIWDIPPEHVTPVVLTLLEICHELKEENQALRDEVARLNGQKPKPKIQPSKLEGGKTKGKKPGKRSRRGKRSKTSRLEIHEDGVIRPSEVPQGSRFKGYEDFTVQDIRIELHNTRYRLERWETPTGDRLVGELPTEVGGVHFGPTLRAFILYQYRHAHVTQPLLLEQLSEWGVDISPGQLSRIITDSQDAFHAEKEALLHEALQRSAYVHVDDTGARHQGKNGYSTHIGNELFAYIEARFDELCATRTCFVSLNKALQRMHHNKAELLLVLQRPDVPLHNNLSENDIREYVKKRKISGSTRSGEGRRCRDTFASLKKTCRKNGISFWEYLQDRLRGMERIPWLASWIFEPTSASLFQPAIQPSGP